MLLRSAVWGWLLAIAVPSNALAQQVPAVRELPALVPKPSSLRNWRPLEPLVIRTQRQVDASFPRLERGRVKKLVDFQRQFLLVFAWRGSSKDRLQFTVENKAPPEVIFHHIRGRTRDLRTHYRAFAVRTNVKWRAQSGPAKGGANPSEQFVQVEMQGQLDSRVVAIGGETTGFAISARGVRFEVAFGGNRQLRDLAKSLHGKLVRVRGRLEARKGVAVRQRTILTATSLRAAATGATGKNPYLTAEGRLRYSLTMTDSQTGFAGNSGYQWTIQSDGNWQRRPFRNRTLQPTDRQGKFRLSQLQSLGKQFSDQDLLGLPEKMGKNPSANPHRFSIKFGDQTRSWVTRGGGPLPLPGPPRGRSPEQRFSYLFRLMQEMMGSPQRPPARRRKQ